MIHGRPWDVEIMIHVVGSVCRFYVKLAVKEKKEAGVWERWQYNNWSSSLKIKPKDHNLNRLNYEESPKLYIKTISELLTNKLSETRQTVLMK